MKASTSATSPSSAAGVPNAMQVFQNALAGQPANVGPVTGSQINDVMAPYPPVVDATMAGVDPGPTAAGSPDAFQVFQDAAAGPPANDDPAAKNQIDDVMAAYPPLGDTATAPDMRDPADDDYPLAIQGLLGDGVYAQPYTDSLNQLSLNTAPPSPDLYVVRQGDTVSSIVRGDYAKMAAIAQANHLKLAADGSPIVRPSDLLLIPNTSGLGPAAHRREVGYGRTMIAGNAQGIAQKHAAQAAAQNAALQLLNRIDPPLSTPQNSWGVPRVSTGQLFTPVTPGIAPNPVDDGLVRTGIQPLDRGLNFASGIEGAGWQAEKDLGKLLYNNSPLGVLVGLADKAGWVRNVPDYVPDQRRTLQPIADFGHALVTHPDQVWQGTKQAAGNLWNSLSQGDPNRQAYAWGGTFLNGLMAADGVAGAVGLASDVGKLARGSEFLSKLGSRGGEALAPSTAEVVAPNIDDYVAGLSSKATPAVSIGNSAYASIGDFTDAVRAKYQALYDQHYADTMQLVDSGKLLNDPLIVGNQVDMSAREGLRDWLANVEGIKEGPGQIIQVNRRLYDPADSGAYRVPDVHIPESKTILDGSLSFKTDATPQIKDFRAFSGGARTTIIRPATAPEAGAGGSYEIVHRGPDGKILLH